MAIAFKGLQKNMFGGPRFDPMAQFQFDFAQRAKDKKNQQDNAAIAQIMQPQQTDTVLGATQPKSLTDIVQQLMAAPDISMQNKMKGVQMAGVMHDMNARPAQQFEFVNLYNKDTGATRKQQIPKGTYNQAVTQIERQIEGTPWQVGQPGKGNKTSYDTIWGFNPKTKSWMPQEYEKGQQAGAVSRLRKGGYTKFRKTPPTASDKGLKANELYIPNGMGGQRLVTEGQLNQIFKTSHNFPDELDLQMMENSGDAQKVETAKAIREKMATSYTDWKKQVKTHGLPSDRRGAPAGGDDDLSSLLQIGTKLMGGEPEESMPLKPAHGRKVNMIGTESGINIGFDGNKYYVKDKATGKWRTTQNDMEVNAVIALQNRTQ